MTAGTILFGFLAGILSTLSPCVLPLLPLVLGSAVAEHRWGAVALSIGMVISFVTIGLFIATLGFSLGLDSNFFRLLAAGLLIGFGVLLLSAGLQQRFAMATAGIGNAGQGFLARLTPAGWQGQLLVGLVLGAIWTPCVGPTLGSASVLASRGQDLGGVAIVMLAFGLGAALPLALIGSLSREALTRWRGRMLQAGQRGKAVLGGAMVLIGLMILSGLDHQIEAFLVRHSPDWLTNLTTRF